MLKTGCEVGILLTSGIPVPQLLDPLQVEVCFMHILPIPVGLDLYNSI